LAKAKVRGDMGMSEPLKNPEQPPGEIVETYEDGGALRNDGVRLTPASQNPWYVLATVAGEQEGRKLRIVARMGCLFVNLMMAYTNKIVGSGMAGCVRTWTSGSVPGWQRNWI
jgi:hypothetical protein